MQLSKSELVVVTSIYAWGECLRLKTNKKELSLHLCVFFCNFLSSVFCFFFFFFFWSSLSLFPNVEHLCWWLVCLFSCLFVSEFVLQNHSLQKQNKKSFVFLQSQSFFFFFFLSFLLLLLVQEEQTSSTKKLKKEHQTTTNKQHPHWGAFDKEGRRRRRRRKRKRMWCAPWGNARANEGFFWKHLKLLWMPLLLFIFSSLLSPSLSGHHHE